MKNKASVGVWVGLVAVTIVQVLIFYTKPGNSTVNVVISILAMLNAVLIGAFSMSLKSEEKTVQYLMITPIILVIVLIVTLLFSFPTG